MQSIFHPLVKILLSMKNYIKSSLVILVALQLGFLTSCNSDSEDELDTLPTQEVAPWNKITSFPEGLFNSYNSNRGIIAIGSRNLYISSDDANTNFNSHNFENFLTRAGRFKLPLSDDRIIINTERDIRIFPNNSINMTSGVEISVFDIDPNFISFEFIPFWQGESVGLTNNGVALIPYRSSDGSGDALRNPSYFLIKTRLVGGKVEVMEQKTINPGNFPNFVSVSRMESFDNFFVTRIGSATMAILENGTFREINRSLSRSLQMENEVWNLALDRNINEITIFKSVDNGGSWTNSGTYKVSNPDVMTADFSSIDGQLVAFTPKQLYRLRILSDRIEVIELDNTNVNGGIISSVTKTSGDRVFITVICDGNNEVCGGYLKSINNFFAAKPGSGI